MSCVGGLLVLIVSTIVWAFLISLFGDFLRRR